MEAQTAIIIGGFLSLGVLFNAPKMTWIAIAGALSHFAAWAAQPMAGETASVFWVGVDVSMLMLCAMNARRSPHVRTLTFMAFAYFLMLSLHVVYASTAITLSNYTYIFALNVLNLTALGGAIGVGLYERIAGNITGGILGWVLGVARTRDAS